MGGDIRLAPGARGGSVFSFALDLVGAEPSPAASPALARAGASSSSRPTAPSRRCWRGMLARRRRQRARHRHGGRGRRARRRRRGGRRCPTTRSSSTSACSPTPAALPRLREAAGAAHSRRGADRARRAAARSSACAQTGFDAYLVRPVRRSSLLRIVGEVIAGDRRLSRRSRAMQGRRAPAAPARAHGEPRGAARRGQPDQRAARPRRARGPRPHGHRGARRSRRSGRRHGNAPAASPPSSSTCTCPASTASPRHARSAPSSSGPGPGARRSSRSPPTCSPRPGRRRRTPASTPFSRSRCAGSAPPRSSRRVTSRLSGTADCHQTAQKLCFTSSRVQTRRILISWRSRDRMWG